MEIVGIGIYQSFLCSNSKRMYMYLYVHDFVQYSKLWKWRFTMSASDVIWHFRNLLGTCLAYDDVGLVTLYPPPKSAIDVFKLPYLALVAMHWATCRALRKLHVWACACQLRTKTNIPDHLHVWHCAWLLQGSPTALIPSCYAPEHVSARTLSCDFYSQWSIDWLILCGVYCVVWELSQCQGLCGILLVSICY